jgi:hypothetical protein
MMRMSAAVSVPVEHAHHSGSFAMVHNRSARPREWFRRGAYRIQGDAVRFWAALLGPPFAASRLRLGFGLGLGRVCGLRGGELLGQRSRGLLEGVSLLTQPAKILQDGIGLAVRHWRKYKGGKEIPATENRS